MSYIIQATIRNFKYYLVFPYNDKDSNFRFDRVRYEGLQNHADIFLHKAEAEEAMNQAKRFIDYDLEIIPFKKT